MPQPPHQPQLPPFPEPLHSGQVFLEVGIIPLQFIRQDRDIDERQMMEEVMTGLNFERMGWLRFEERGDPEARHGAMAQRSVTDEDGEVLRTNYVVLITLPEVMAIAFVDAPDSYSETEWQLIGSILTSVRLADEPVSERAMMGFSELIAIARAEAKTES